MDRAITVKRRLKLLRTVIKYADYSLEDISKKTGYSEHLLGTVIFGTETPGPEILKAIEDFILEQGA